MIHGQHRIPLFQEAFHGCCALAEAAFQPELLICAIELSGELIGTLVHSNVCDRDRRAVCCTVEKLHMGPTLLG